MISASKLYAQYIFAILMTSNLSAALPPNIETYLRDEQHSVTEDNFLPSRLPGDLDFVRSVTANWREVLQAAPTLAPDGRQQSLLVVAGEFLPPKEYLNFIGVLCDLRSQNRLAPESLRFILWASMAKSGFLAYNFDHPDVIAAVARLKKQIDLDYPNDWKDFFDDLKSGKMKARLIERRTRDGDKMPENVETYDETTYHQLQGGSVKADAKLLVQRPIEAVTSLASTNRTRWSMIVALVAVIGAAIGLIVLLLKIKRRGKR